MASTCLEVESTNAVRVVGRLPRATHVRMAKNLGMTHGLIVAEAVMMGLAPHTGRTEAHDLVYDACRLAIESDRALCDVLLETPAVAGPLGEATLRALTDPANYLGAAQAMVDRVLNGR